jgi:polyisoprenoid-binding protein YceI
MLFVGSWAAVGMLGSARQGSAAGLEFDFNDPKKVNAIVFILDSPLEPIVGVASGIFGMVNFDPQQPKSTSGAISVPVKNLHTENRGMKDTIHGPDWIDVGKNPNIEFKLKEVKEVKEAKDNVYEMQVVGEMSIKGVTKPLTVPVKAHYLKDKASSRSGQMKGDLLVLRSEFTIKRKDFGIKPDMGNDVVAEDIQLRVSIVGIHKK